MARGDVCPIGPLKATGPDGLSGHGGPPRSGLAGEADPESAGKHACTWAK